MGAISAECIKYSFPKNDKGSRIIITTRYEDVAPPRSESLDYYVYKLSPLPFEKAFELFCKKVFKCEGGQWPPEFVDISFGIVEKCGGIPLAIVAIGGLFSTKAKVVSKWNKVLDSLSSEFEINSYLRSIARILAFSYHDLPYNLKASKGFVKEKKGHTLEDVILSRSEELNFNLVSMSNFSNFKRIAQRLSIQINVNTRLQNITNSQICSILILEVHEVPNSFLSTCFANFKLMKIMDCEVGNLFHLRYLSLRDTKVQMLPKSIGKLHNLETLDLKQSLVAELPMEISGLCKLQYLVAYNHNKDTKFNINSFRGVKIPNGIGLLKSLQKLSLIEASTATLITELGSLSHLKKLVICKLKKENGMDLCTAIQKMSHLRSLGISATSEEEVLNLQSLPSPPPLLQTLFLLGQLEKFPKWIPKLKSMVKLFLYWSKLMKDPLKVLQALPILMNLALYDGYKGEQLHIEGGGFQKLKFLQLRYLGGLNRLIIDEGALPLLEMLQIGPCPYLKILKFFDMPTEFVISLQGKCNLQRCPDGLV
ncbi:hypothetical protein RGQ29_026565 [Quercus rubra]|uniref:NB-ARC domain-containing protein n=1 Tax=Quercus rubra TaxID=3512 RepID=A0AAN7IJA7_QUERU|nr:hypothetical protein RGQ29_026565 [Quercus rubra]